MVAIFCAYYNYCRPHKSLGKGTTPAMAAGLTDYVWTLSGANHRRADAGTGEAGAEAKGKKT